MQIEWQQPAGGSGHAGNGGTRRRRAVSSPANSKIVFQSSI
jgi:hypothetical protein